MYAGVMQPRTLALAAVVAVAALAGCSALTGGGAEYPPGASQNGIDNATELLRQHEVQTLDDSYRVAITYTEIHEDENGSETVQADNRTYLVDADDEEVLSRATSNGEPFRERYWAASEGVYQVDIREDGNYYRGGRRGWSFAEARENLVRTGAGDYIAGGNYTFVNTTDAQGKTLIHYRLDTMDGQDSDQVSGRLVIDEQGRLHEFQYRYEATGDTGAYTSNFTVTWAYGVDLDRPDWVDEATE